MPGEPEAVGGDGVIGAEPEVKLVVRRVDVATVGKYGSAIAADLERVRRRPVVYL